MAASVSLHSACFNTSELIILLRAVVIRSFPWSISFSFYCLSNYVHSWACCSFVLAWPFYLRLYFFKCTLCSCSNGLPHLLRTHPLLHGFPDSSFCLECHSLICSDPIPLRPFLNIIYSMTVLLNSPNKWDLLLLWTPAVLGLLFCLTFAFSFPIKYAFAYLFPLPHSRSCSWGLGLNYLEGPF